MSRPLLLALFVAACGGTEPTPQKAPPERAAAATPPPAPTEPAAPEGMVWFKNPDAPFKTAYPKEGVSQLTACSESGCEYLFAMNDDAGKPRKDARVTLWFPKPWEQTDTLTKKWLEGDTSAFKKNPTWKKSGESEGNAAQPWLKKVVSFEDGNNGVGRLLFGESKQGSFVITELLNQSDLEKARPLVAAIYANLELRP